MSFISAGGDNKSGHGFPATTILHYNAPKGAAIALSPLKGEMSFSTLHLITDVYLRNRLPHSNIPRGTSVMKVRVQRP